MKKVTTSVKSMRSPNNNPQPMKLTKIAKNILPAVIKVELFKPTPLKGLKPFKGLYLNSDFMEFIIISYCFDLKSL